LEFLKEKKRVEEREIERLLGFRTRKIKKKLIHKFLLKTDSVELIELKNRQKIYFLKEFPELSLEEAELVKETVEEFQAKEGREEEKNLLKEFNSYCKRNLIELDREQKNYLYKLIESIAFGFGPLNTILADDSIEEVSLAGLTARNPVRVFEKNYGWIETNLYYSSEQTVKDLVNRMARKIGRRLSMQTPKINAVLPDGSRLNATIKPVSFTGPSFTIRKFKEEPFTPLDLIENNTFTAELMAFIWMALESDASIVVAGNTGSGKTTTLNSLFSFVPRNERIIVAEETPEIKLPHRHLIKLNTIESLGIGMQELITDTLRMRPDRIIVGEIRSREEINAFIDTMLAGQGKGSYATFHAQSSQEAITRMKNYGIIDLDLQSIDLLLIQKRWTQVNLKRKQRKETRKIIEASEILLQGNQIKINKLYEFNYKKNELEKKNQGIKAMQKIMNCLGLSKRKAEKEIKRRERILKKMLPEKYNLKEFFERINQEMQ